MRNIEEILDFIEKWQGSFRDLVKEFTPEEYKEITENYYWENDDLEGMADEYNKFECYDDLLELCITEALLNNINIGIIEGTDNLYRLWRE